MPLSEDRLLSLVRERCDAWEGVDLCDLSTDDLVDLLRDQIMERQDRCASFLENV